MHPWQASGPATCIGALLCFYRPSFLLLYPFSFGQSIRLMSVVFLGTLLINEILQRPGALLSGVDLHSTEFLLNDISHLKCKIISISRG